ncbi:MAG: hypothetical protein AAB423_01455 [Patescibacteria group bacterium]
MRKINLSATKVRIFTIIICLVSVPFIFYGIFSGFYSMDGPSRQAPSTINNIASILWQLSSWALIYVGIFGTIANLVVSIINIFIKNYLVTKISIYFSLFIIILSILTAIFIILSMPPIIYPIGG